MFVYGSEFFVFKPGLILAVLGAVLTGILTFGDLRIGALSLSLNWQFLGLALFVVGLQAFFLGCIAQVLFDYTGQRTRRWLRTFAYTRTVLIAAALILIGMGLAVPLAVAYINNDLSLNLAAIPQDHIAVTGLAVAIAGAQLFVFVLLLHGAVVASGRRRSKPRD
jgi:hypothetical protein